MAEFLKKATVPIDFGKMTDKDMSCNTVMTEDFFQFNIPYCFELIPDNKISGVIKAFGRNTAMKRPLLGSAKCIYRKFWVPFRVVWPPYNAFRVGSPYTTDQGTQIIPHVPLLKMSTLATFFIEGYTDSDYTILPAVNQVLDPTAISSGLYDLERDGLYYSFTRRGRLTNKLLMSLGYRVIPVNKVDGVDLEVSALPLLCAAKVYFDWFWPTQYAQVGQAAVFQGITHRHFTYTMTLKEIALILQMIIYTFYENDLFTSAWDNPVAPSQGAYNSFVIPDITNNSSYNGSFARQVVSNDGSLVGSPNVSTVPTNGTPFVGGNYSPVSNITNPSGVFTQYVDNALHIATDLMRKYAIVGSRALERYLSVFGVKLSAEQLDRSQYLGQSVTPWQIGEVFSQADTTTGTRGAMLGDYAGKGLTVDQGFSLDYNNPSEYGFFLVVHTILPKISYVQGLDPHCLHKTMMDFFDGKLEQLGTAPIPKITLFAGSRGSYNPNQLADQVFGFSRRYYEYVVPRDRLLGDFACPSVNTGLMAWSLARIFDENNINFTNLVHSLTFMNGQLDNLQYDRVFYGSTMDVARLDENTDNFKFVHFVSVKFASRTRPFYENYEWMDPDNKSVTIDGNGVRMS